MYTLQILELGNKLQFVMISGNISPKTPFSFEYVRWLQWPELKASLDWKTLPYVVYVDVRESAVEHLNGIEVNLK